MEKNKKLPNDWEWAKISDVVLEPKKDIVDGPFGSNLKSKHYVNSGVPIIRIQNVQRFKFIHKNFKFITQKKAKELERHSFSKNDIVITKLGIPVGKTCLVPDYLEDGVIIADVLRMRIKDEFMSRKFLMYLFNSGLVIKQFNQQTKGTTRPRVNLTKFRNFDIPVAPLNEQKRIVEKIEELFSEIENAKKLISNMKLQLKQYEKSLLKSAFKGELVNFEQKQVQLSELFEKKHGQFLPKNKMIKGTIPVFGGNGIIGYHNENYLVGDILIIGRVGAHCGNVRHFSGKLWITDNTIGLLPKMKINSKFFLYQLRHMKLNEMSAGSGQPYISGKMLSELNLVTTDISIQNKIVFQIEQGLSFLENSDIITNLLNKQLDNSQSSILKQAFEGKLVPQDPNDEPASELLKRIKSK